MKKNIILSLILLTITTITYSQVKVGNNPTTINSNSLLELESTNKGILLPRVALTSTNSASPLSSFVAGMLVYNTATAGTAPNNVTPGTYISNGAAWIRVLDAVNSTLSTGTVQNSSFTAMSGIQYPVNTSSGALTLTLPASPIMGQTIGVLDYARTFGTNNLTINPNGSRLANQLNNYVLNTNGTNVELKYIDNVQGWIASDFFTWNPTFAPLTGDALIQSNLSTNLSAFNAASAGTAVEITLSEWNALNTALSAAGGGKAGCTNTQLTTSVGSTNGTVFTGNYTDHSFGNLTTVPANRRVYAFAVNIPSSSVNSSARIKSFHNTTAIGTDLHTNTIPITVGSTAPRYYVIKTPPAVVSNVQIIGSYVLDNHYKLNTGTSNGYIYLFGNNNTNSFTSSTHQAIPLIQFAFGVQ